MLYFINAKQHESIDLWSRLLQILHRPTSIPNRWPCSCLLLQ